MAQKSGELGLLMLAQCDEHRWKNENNRKNDNEPREAN